jgi:hypothetical protein
MDRYILLTYAAPASPGAAPVTYEYSVNGGGFVTTPYGAVGVYAYIFTGCGYGGQTFTVTMRAVNSYGPGPTSNTMSLTYGHYC